MTRLIPLIIVSFIGVLIIMVGIVLWKKQEISLIHGYHYTKVKSEDIKYYTEAIGKATIVAGMTMTSLAITKMVTYIPSYVGNIIIILGVVMSTAMFYMAQRKYNKGIF